MRIILIIQFIICAISFQGIAQTAFNKYISLQENSKSGIVDVECLLDGSFLSSVSFNDGSGIAPHITLFDKYGNLSWTKDITYLEFNGSKYGTESTYLNDSIFIAAQILGNASTVVPSVDLWWYDTALSIYNINNDSLFSFLPETNYAAYFLKKLATNSKNQIVSAGGVIYPNQAYESFDSYVNIIDLEGNTLYEHKFFNPEYYDIVQDLLILPNDDIVVMYVNCQGTSHPDYYDSRFKSVTLQYLTPELEIVWSKKIEEVAATCLNLDRNGNILLGARNKNILRETPDLHIASILALYNINVEDGNILWMEEYDLAEIRAIWVKEIYEKENGQIMLAGDLADYTEPYQINSREQCFYMQLDTNRQIINEKWYKHFEEQKSEYSYEVAICPDKGFVYGGVTEGSYSSGIDRNIWLLKTDSLGNDWLPLNAFFEKDTIEINVNEKVTLKPIPYGGTNIYTHQWSGATEYLDNTSTWYPTFTGSEVGTFTITYEVLDSDESLASSSIVVKVNDIYSSNNSLNNHEISVYPNPTNDVINFNGITSVTKIIITDFQGKTIMKKTNSFKNISIKDWHNGLYFYQIFEKEKLLSKGKFLVKN